MFLTISGYMYTTSCLQTSCKMVFKILRLNQLLFFPCTAPFALATGSVPVMLPKDSTSAQIGKKTHSILKNTRYTHLLAR